MVLQWPKQLIVRRLIKTILLVCLWLMAGPAAAAPDYTRERKAYQTALSHLAAGRISHYQTVRKTLEQYPLAPWLDFQEYKRRLATLTVAEIDGFETRYPDLPAALELREGWLKAQAAKSNWKALLQGYPTDDRVYGIELQCYKARAELAAGTRENALAAALTLWMTGKSQPIACDPLFTDLRQSGRITQDLTWQRMELAFAANSIQLGRHLITRLAGDHRIWGEAYYQAHIDPRRLLVPERFSKASPRVRRVLLNGLVRLAARNPAEAYKVWPTYRDQHAWSADEQTTIERAVWQARASQGIFPEPTFKTNDPLLLATLATMARDRQNWRELARFITLMPDDERKKIEWQYWLARAMEENRGDPAAIAQIYRGIATQRQYYGFLAAEKAGLPAQLAQTPVTALGPEAIDAMTKYPNGARGLEFFARNEAGNARREWVFGADNLGPEAAREFTYAALHKGFPHFGIFLANRAGLLDEVSVRFPMLYRQEFDAASKRSRLPVPLLFAVTRQESAFDRQARSVADARGLMQLLPSTARWVAERTRQRAPSDAALYEPSTNINLGSTFLAGLLSGYQNQLPLAAAAYNAGPGRVKKWTSGVAGMPMDVWIETIPFNETRNYVKNVLAFRVVYGLLLKQPQPLLGPHELLVLRKS